LGNEVREHLLGARGVARTFAVHSIEDVSHGIEWRVYRATERSSPNAGQATAERWYPRSRVVQLARISFQANVGLERGCAVE
jgi:hypothetical protein